MNPSVWRFMAVNAAHAGDCCSSIRIINDWRATDQENVAMSIWNATLCFYFSLSLFLSSSHIHCTACAQSTCLVNCPHVLGRFLRCAHDVLLLRCGCLHVIMQPPSKADADEAGNVTPIQICFEIGQSSLISKCVQLFRRSRSPSIPFDDVV